MPLGGGGGTGSSLVSRTVKTLTDAQIKTLPSTPVEIVPAPGAGKMLLLVQGLLAWDDYSNAVGYTNVTAVQNGSAFAAVFYDATTNGAPASALVMDDAGFDNVYRNWLAGIDNLLVLTPNAYPSPTVAQGMEIPDRHNAAVNMGLYLGSANPAGNYTGGDPTNSMTVTLLTATVDIL